MNPTLAYKRLSEDLPRREFLKVTGLGAASALWPWGGLEARPHFEEKALLILHTNDVHSRIDPFPASNTRYAGQGGAEGRARRIAAIRNRFKNVLLLDAGDIFQGTPYFNLYKGEPEIKLMSAMGYDAATLGNHDFDLGVEGFAQQLPHARFDVICSNYNLKNGALGGKTLEHKIYRKGPYKVGVFGLGIELKGLVTPKLYGDTKYLDPIEVARVQVGTLRKQGCNLVVCLSHLGFQYESDKVSDRVLAKECPGIDLIIGGHTHTFVEEEVLQHHPNDPSCRIVQAGWGGLRLGQVLFYPKGLGDWETASALLRT
ncbi:bifunctional metallophosphatase/5'-nucleotidase [bacterium]|nr:bifunctional metallophosphatase/5'-nucleotidase [bacterium]